jgi:hypothetical protein
MFCFSFAQAVRSAWLLTYRGKMAGLTSRAEKLVDDSRKRWGQQGESNRAWIHYFLLIHDENIRGGEKKKHESLP